MIVGWFSKWDRCHSTNEASDNETHSIVDRTDVESNDRQLSEQQKDDEDERNE